jgi:hypothetical protein
MFPISTYSFEGRLQRFLDSSGMSVTTFTAILNVLGVKITQTRLTTALNGRANGIGGEALAEIEPIFTRLRSLVASVQPFVLDLRRPALVASWLQAMANGELTIAVSNSNTASPIHAPGEHNPAPQDAHFVVGDSHGGSR